MMWSRHNRAVKDTDTENEELIADIQNLIEENGDILKELESTKTSNHKLEAENAQLRNENFMLLDRLEKKRLGWIEETEVEELKRQTKAPLLRKLQASRKEANELEALVRLLDAERDDLAEQLAKAVDWSLELSNSDKNKQKMIDELHQAYKKVCEENSILKSRIRTFIPDATFEETPLLQIVPTSLPQVRTPVRKEPTRLMELIPHIFPLLKASPNQINPGLPVISRTKIDVWRGAIFKHHFKAQRRHSFHEFSQSLNRSNAFDQVQELFEMGKLGNCSDDDDEDLKAIPVSESREILRDKVLRKSSVIQSLRKTSLIVDFNQDSFNDSFTESRLSYSFSTHIGNDTELSTARTLHSFRSASTNQAQQLVALREIGKIGGGGEEDNVSVVNGEGGENRMHGLANTLVSAPHDGDEGSDPGQNSSPQSTQVSRDEAIRKASLLVSWPL